MNIVHRWGQRLHRQCQQWLASATSTLRKNTLGRRMVKNIACTTITIIIGLIPEVVEKFGPAAFFGAMVTIFGYPGQRFGQMAEVLILIVLGIFAGIAWSALGLYLSGLVYAANDEVALAIRAVFFVPALIFHGVLRSSTPRLFMFVFFFLLINTTILTATDISVSTTMITNIAYPVLAAVGIVVFVNIVVFPEFSSGFLGRSTIETLCATMDCFLESGDWFMTDTKQPDGEDTEKGKEASIALRTRLIALTENKTKLRAQLSNCKKAQAECNFELVFAVLPPRSLKPISMTLMSRLVQITICLINACESKYALAGQKYGEDEPEEPRNKDSDGEDSEQDTSSSSDSESESDSDNGRSQSESSSTRRKSRYLRNLKRVKPIRQIEFGDIELLEHILDQISAPTKALQENMRAAVHVISSALGYCYDVARLPSGSPAPKGIRMEEIDIRVDMFAQALSQFDRDSAAALEHAASIEYGRETRGDVMPKMEMHLISSFLISVRQAAAQVMEMLGHSRALVERRQARNSHRRLYWPKIGWKKWLTSGGETDINALPERARKEARTGHGLREEPEGPDDSDMSDSDTKPSKRGNDEEAGRDISRKATTTEKGHIPMRKSSRESEGTTISSLRELAADVFEFLADSDALAYATKLSIAACLITWPAFVPSYNPWYNSIRGSWASFQLVLVFEVSVGTSLQGFFLRVFGVIFGCLVGFISYEIGQGNRVVAVVILVLGLIPSAYIQLGTPYVKTGIIAATSLSVVGLAIILQPRGDAPWQVFIKRMACFLVGGTVALLVEMFLFPVRTRDRLVESLASSIQQISQMEGSVAVGIDSPRNIDTKSYALDESFKDAKEKAEQALDAARTFLPFCLAEPRLKGSFKGQALIYREMIYVLFQIIDRMDDMLHIRRAYGSSVLEELNAEVLSYRRNVAASIMLTLFAVHEALTTRLPLPQFLPSSRVAQLRYISRVRELLLERVPKSAYDTGTQTPVSLEGSSTLPQAHVLRSMARQSFLSWNASSAGMMEIIEFLEELIDLAKLLVGVNAFRSGMLERPKYYEYVRKIKERESSRATAAAAAAAAAAAEAENQEAQKTRLRSGSTFVRRRRGFTLSKMPSHGTASTGIAAVTKSASHEPRLRRPSTGIWASSASDATTAKGGNETTATAAAVDLPMSLQRVMTKRMEGRRQESIAKHKKEKVEEQDGSKGKLPLVKPVQTWSP